MTSKHQGFTLIELLVVITIISMLASIVLVSLTSARDKGITAGALQFADTNLHAFGADAVAIYNFNESGGVGSPPTGNILHDTSGNSFNLNTCSGLTLSADTPGGVSGNLSGSFATAGKCTYSFTVTGNVPTFTMSTWVKLVTVPGSGATSMITVGATGAFLQLNNSTNKIQCKTASFSGNAAISNTVLQTNKWYHVACSRDSAATPNLFLYINGVREGITSTNNSSMSWALNDVLSMWNNASSAGLMDDTVIYSHQLADSDVYRIFAEGATRHGLSLK